MESIKNIIVLSFLIFTLVPSFSSADTTGNLILNGTFESGNSNNWTTTGEVTVLNDCCGSQYDLEIGLSGSISQSFDLTSDTITQPMLNNGITLNSSVLVQSGEGGNGGWCNSCGPTDSFTVQLQIKDSDNNVLATTTQERFNVTSITGEVFSDSVAYTQSGSNRGAITLSGTDGAGVAGGLGGPNFDNIEVTMTYDPVVLSVSQTEEINTALTFVGEVEQEIETIFFEPITEIKIEEYKQPELTTLVFKEFLIEELAQEEINTGIINIFEEVTYEEPQTIEAFSTEIESFETEIETTEITNIGGSFEGGSIQEGETIEEAIEYSGEIESESREEKIAQAEPEEEGTGTGNGEASTENETRTSTESGETTSREEESSEQVEENNQEPQGENTVASEEINETDGETETSDSESGSEGTEVADATEENTQSSSQEVEEGGDRETVDANTRTISVADIERKVNATVKRTDQRLALTSMIVTKAMSKNRMLDSYANINQDIFKDQLQIDGGNYYETREYIDDRNIYAQNQDVFYDPMATYQRNVQETVDEVIRAEENLRRIRGY